MIDSVRLMKIEKFAIADGPGIRTTVFLQGCPLRCPWCANPESQQLSQQLLYDANKCVHCLTCLNNCPHQAISFVDNQLLFNRDKCQFCHRCGEECLNGAISYQGMETKIAYIMDQVKRDILYYQESNGGVTFSGGEPFVQYEGLKEMLHQCKQAQIHTAIETTGDVEYNKIEAVLNDVDLFLYDMKGDSAEMIKNLTLGNGERIIANITKLAKTHPEKVIMRVPCIPNYNFQKETIENILNFAKNIGIQEVHLLPFHNMATSKYHQLGRTYLLEDTKMMEKSELEPYAEYGRKLNLKVQVGG